MRKYLNPLLCQLIKLPVHTFNITLIGKAVIAIVPDNDMLMRGDVQLDVTGPLDEGFGPPEG